MLSEHRKIGDETASMAFGVDLSRWDVGRRRPYGTDARAQSDDTQLTRFEAYSCHDGRTRPAPPPYKRDAA